MKKPWLLACLVLAVLADLGFTYAQNLRLTIDGDLVAIVVPRADCTVMSWETITNPSASVTNAELLAHWGITKGHKLHYYAGH